MRVRNKPWADDYMTVHADKIVMDPTQFVGKWQSRFEKAQPLQVEIGTGKGQFIVGMAKAHPEINFIGIEIQKSVIAAALKNVVESDLPNVQLLHTDGENVNTFFANGEIDELFLNFSDPWPKKRHIKRRLTSPGFLSHYQEVLKEDGALQFKTDNRGLFEYSLTAFNNFGMTFDQVWLDLHQDETAMTTNIQTEYEEKFSQKGPIYQIVARFEEKQ